MQRFYWVVQGTLAGCSRPGDHAMPQAGPWVPGGSGAADGLDRDLSWLRQQEIGALLSLTETPLGDDAPARHDLDVLHLPVPDLTAPTPAQLREALHFIDLQRSRGRATAVHCLQGQGRTGTVLAAYLIRQGRDAEEAIRELRTLCPGALSVPEQEQALRVFARERAWIL